MLKINKTKPYQFRKVHDNSSYVGRVVCALALICGIMPGLMGLSYYGSVEKASAATLSIDNISTMQEMRPGICYNMKIGDSATLTDIRDNNAYTIAKLSDGKCWMTQNLRIVDKEITPEDSDVTENFTIPVSKTTGFSDDNVANVYYSGNTTYGSYYSWFAATASTGKASTSNTDAKSSICPKNWKLPTWTDFTSLNSNGYSKRGIWEANSTTSGYWIGSSTDDGIGGAFWPAAGTYSPNASKEVGINGLYWSKTATANTSYAYNFGFGVNNRPSLDNFYYGKSNGLTVRCVADSYEEVLPEIDKKNVDIIAIVVPPVISIDATSGMKEEVDPNKVTTGTISATVSANTAYSVQLSASKTSLTNSALGVDTEITSSNSIPASTNVQAKTNAWGILNSDNSTYSAITTNPTKYYSTEDFNEETQSTKHTFTLGVSVSPTLPAGEYSTTVTITAVNN